MCAASLLVIILITYAHPTIMSLWHIQSTIYLLDHEYYPALLRTLLVHAYMRSLLQVCANSLLLVITMMSLLCIQNTTLICFLKYHLVLLHTMVVLAQDTCSMRRYICCENIQPRLRKLQVWAREREPSRLGGNDLILPLLPIRRVLNIANY